MSVASDPAEIFERAVEEGERRLDQSLLELVSTSFIAGFTVVFGAVALGIVKAAVEPQFGSVATVAGALAFGVGLFVAVLSVEGTLPTGTPRVLVTIAEEIVARAPAAEFVKAIAGGALVSLLSFLLAAADSVGSRIWLVYVVGVMLTLGPFDHVIVTMLHVLFGALLGTNIGLGALAETTAVVTAGNLVGGPRAGHAQSRRPGEGSARVRRLTCAGSTVRILRQRVSERYLRGANLAL